MSVARPKFRRKSVIEVSERDPIDLIKAVVEFVKDGDGVLVSRPEKRFEIRLSGIDCPEFDQLWGSEATNALINMIGGREVFLETYGLDVHKRTLATIFVDNGDCLMNVNARMVVCGHAWVARKFYGHLTRDRQRQLNEMEKWAKKNRVGLWKFDNPIPPWKHRKAG